MYLLINLYRVIIVEMCNILMSGSFVIEVRPGTITLILLRHSKGVIYSYSLY